MDIRELFEGEFKNAGNYDAELFKHDGHEYMNLGLENAFLGYGLGYKKGLAQNINQREAYQRGHKAGYETGLDDSIKECEKEADYYLTCAADRQPDEYECCDIAHGATNCAEAIKKLRGQDNG